VNQIQNGLKNLKKFADCHEPYNRNHECEAAPNGKFNHASRGGVGLGKHLNTLAVSNIMIKKEKEDRVVQLHLLPQIADWNIVKQRNNVKK
jgi:hypothetical protein